MSEQPPVYRSVGIIREVTNAPTKAAPSNKGEFVFFLGALLIVASGLTSKNFQKFGDLLFNAKNMKYTRQEARVAMVIISGETLFLIILTALSEASDDFANAMIVLFFALFLVWSIANVQTTSGWVNFLTGKSKNI